MEMKKDTHTSISSGILGVVIIGGLLWELAIVMALWGFWIAALASFLFPATLALVPWYMLFVYGNWQLLTFTYGGFLLGGLIFSLGDDSSDECAEDAEHAYNIEIGESESQEYSAAISDCTERDYEE